MEMSEELFDVISSTLDNNPNLEVSLRTYSGRGMYGHETLGVVLPINQLPMFIFCAVREVVAAELDDWAFEQWVQDLSTDSMGYRDSVVYNTRFTLTPALVEKIRDRENECD